ncbi:peptidylprolyl isomerase [Falsiroseomonas sp.]|uniref:peptidylprolyl isomerase n=1 Tax=Falsiroseomonas sp. TaxID=2870721 RepID=UPI003565C9C0
MAIHIHPPPPPAPPAAAPAQAALPEHDIVVNGTVIPAREVAAEMQHHPAVDAFAAWEEAARALVVRRLLLDAAAAAGLDPAEEDDAIGALLAREIRVPEPDEAAARRWFAANPDRFGTPEWWDASHILLAADPEDAEERSAARTRATALLAQVQEVPGSLPDLARLHSACPSREQGGHLGRIERGSTVPEFETFLAALVPGQVCPEVVQTRYGMHVVQLHHHAPRRTPRFEDAVPEVMRDLARVSWQSAVRHYIAVLAARATIEGFALSAEGEARADGPLVN